MARQVYPKLNDMIEEQMKRAGMVKDMELKQVVGEITVTKPESTPPKLLTSLPEGIAPGTKTVPSNWMRPIPIGDPIPEKASISQGEYKCNPIAPIYSPEAKLTEEQEKHLQEKYKEITSVKIEQTKAARYNANKRKWSLLPLEVLEPIIEVLEFGAKKYAAWNFTASEGLSWTEVGESLQRHLNAWMRGEDLDPESGMSHLGHIGCNLVFLLYYMKYKDKYGVRDDRNKR